MQLGGYSCDDPPAQGRHHHDNTHLCCPYPQRQDSWALLLLFDLLEVLAVVPLLTRAGIQDGRDHRTAKRRCQSLGSLCEVKLTHHANGMNHWPKPGQHLCPGSRSGGAKGPTNVQLPGCCHTRRDYNQQTKPPTEAVAGPGNGGSLCAN